MTYKVEETQFWGGNLGYAKPVVRSSLGDGNVAAIAEDFQYVTKAPPGGYIETVKALRETIQDLTKAGRPAVDSDFIKPTQAVKFDEGKRDWSLLPYDSIEEIIKVLEFGAKKYNEPGQGPDTWNWAKGAGLGKWRTLAAIFRHLTSYAKGETYDPESGLNHLAHVGCGVLFLLHYHGNPKQYGKLD
jgi:hypothetical protein